MCVAAVGGTGSANARVAAPGGLAAKAALGEVGTPYVWGGASPGSGFDSSGLVVWAYAQAGIPGLPQASPALWTAGKHVSRSHLRPGDLVFFHEAGHVGIYLGRGRFVHAPHTGANVTVARLSGDYLRYYTGAVRIFKQR
jgi:cell wall-associated NlpC family hydrolase